MAGGCLKYGKNIYRPEVLFDKIRQKPEFFAKKHQLTGFDVERVIGKQKSDIQYSFLNESDFDADGNVKPEVLKQIEAERNSIKEKAIADGTFLKVKDKNGNLVDSKLNEQQWVDVRTKRFKDWFGDWETDPENASKVVDENGEPKIITHSTDKNFNEFINQQENDAGWLGSGFYFFGDRSLDGQYGENVMEVFSNAKEPYYISDEEYNDLVEQDDAEYSRQFTEDKISEGYDAVFYNGNYNEEWNVFSPNQIKSATDNLGTYSANSNRIDFNIVGERGVLNSADKENNIRNLQIAQKMQDEGKSNAETILATGWYKGNDGKWRVALDSKPTEKEYDYSKNSKTTLDDLIEYPELFEYYPELKDSNVVITDDSRIFSGNYPAAIANEFTKTIYLNKNYFNDSRTKGIDRLRTIIHEVQHRIQGIEGFDRGTNDIRVGLLYDNIYSGIQHPFIRTDEADSAERAIERMFGRDWKDQVTSGNISPKEIKDALYDLSYGEHEARTAEKLLESDDKKRTLIVEDTVANEFKYYVGGNVGVQYSIRNTLPHTNVIPATTLRNATNKLLSEGEDAAREEIQNSAWYKNSSDSKKKEIDNANIANLLLEHATKQKENLKAKREQDKQIKEAEKQKAKERQDNAVQANPNISYKNDKPRNRFIAFKEKWFANEGGLLKFAMNASDKAKGATALEIRIAKELIHTLNTTAKKHKFTDWKIFDDALRGDSDAYQRLDDNMKPFINQMRMKLDGMTDYLLDNNLVSESQAIVLEENKGKYVSRAYEFFESKDNFGKVFRRIFSKDGISSQFDKDKWFDAVTVYQQNVLNEISYDAKWKGKSEEEMQAYARKEGERRLKEYILKLEEDYNQAKSTRGANVDILKERKDVPEPIRKLLGEYTDPRVSYAITISKMASMAYQRKFLQEVREMGMGTLFFEESDPNIPSTHTVKIASDTSQPYSPLNGLYTTPEFKDVFLDVADPTANDFFTLWIKLTGGIKYGKTILSPITQAVNFTANFGFLIQNGLWDIRGLGYGSKLFYDEFVKMNRSNDPFIKELISENIIGQNLSLNEIENDFHKNIEKNLINEIKRSRVMDIATYAVSIPQKLYAASDNFFKAYAYYQETNDYAKAMYRKPYKELVGKEREEVKAIASEVVKNTLANYDRKYKAADVVRKGTRNILGNFLSFQAESIRTYVNSVQIAMRDIKNPRTRSVGIRRMAGVVAYQAAYGMITSYVGKITGMGLYGLLSAFDDDDEKEVNKNLNLVVAPWARSTEKYFKLNPDGSMSYYTYGNINPYGIIYKTVNAYNNGTDGVQEGGLKASALEFVQPFVGTEMSVKWLLNISAGENDYGKELIGTQDYIDYTLDKLSPTFVKLLKDNRDNNTNNDFDKLNLLGIKKYNLDLTDQLNFRFSDYQNKVNKIGKEMYGLNYKLEDGVINQQEYDEKMQSLLMKQKQITDEFIPVFEAHQYFGASIDQKGGVLEKGNKNYINIYNSSKHWMPYLTAPKEERDRIFKEMSSEK